MVSCDEVYHLSPFTHSIEWKTKNRRRKEVRHLPPDNRASWWRISSRSLDFLCQAERSSPAHLIYRIMKAHSLEDKVMRLSDSWYHLPSLLI